MKKVQMLHLLFQAKLCLIVMSLPAYEVLRIPMQKAIKVL